MTALHLGPSGPIDPPANDGFEVSYVPDDGAEHRVPLARAWAVPFERGVPVRRRNSVPNSAVRCSHHALKPNSVDSRVRSNPDTCRLRSVAD